jgi:hypothetical protein
VADVVPVDYVARLIIGSAATVTLPNDYQVPQVATVLPTINQELPTINIQEAPKQPMLPSEHKRHKRTSSTASRVSVRSSIMYQPKFYMPNHQEHQTLPMIYQVSIASKRPVNWRVGYEAIRQYWTKSTNINLPPAKTYFTASQRNSTMDNSSPGLSRARTVMNSLRGYYMNSSNSDTTPMSNGSASSVTVTPMASHSSERLPNASNKRNSHRLSRTVDKAAKLANTMRDSMYTNGFSNTHITNDHTNHLACTLRDIDVQLLFDPSVIVPEDVDNKFWVNYLTNASYGIHYYVCQETNLRVPTPVYGWSCGIQATHLDGMDTDQEDTEYFENVLNRPVQSAIFSQDQIIQRTARMVAHIKGLLMHSIPLVVNDDAWLTDLDDSLDDWCQQDVEEPRSMALGKWRRKVGSNDESVKIIVLNDKRVNAAITQITQNAGVPKQTAVNEAMKILMRMSERTQLAFVWFAGTLLKSLLDDMFEHVRILDERLRAIRQSTMGKRVVYVPVSKSLLDPLVVWYIAVRYRLPVPALACDEGMSPMGPLSDVYRLAGAYYVKRDKSKRSPLNSAVTAAYTQVLLREHGALSFCLERWRSRTGKFQEAYADGLVDMVIEATLQTNQQANPRSSTISRVASSELTTPPASPDSLVSSPTMSIDSLANVSIAPRKVHKDVVFVPINITYENVPELPHLIDEVLDQQPTKAGGAGRQRSASQTGLQNPVARPSMMVRPSEAKDRRKTVDAANRKCGRVTFGVGPLISVQDVAEEFNKRNLKG